jgi:agarase
VQNLKEKAGMTRHAVGLASRNMVCRWLWPVLVVLGVSLNIPAQESELDRFGGSTSIRFKATGVFRTEHDGKRWWLVTPDGGAFLSAGVNFVQFEGDAERGTGRRYYGEATQAKYGSREKWAEATLQRFREWGVNTIAGWSGSELWGQLPFTMGFAFAPGQWCSRGDSVTPDFFDPAWEASVNERAASAKENSKNPWLIGYFLDNELPWATDHRFGKSVFDGYLGMAPDAPGKQRMVAFFQERYPVLEDFASVWDSSISAWDELAGLTDLGERDWLKARADREAFIRVVAERYFEVTCAAVRAADPNHLILGARFIWQTVPRGVVEACGKHCDVVSINFYETGWLGKILLNLGRPDVDRITNGDDAFARFFVAAQRPLMITEFSFRAMDSDPGNTFPPGYITQPTVATQQDRAAKYEHYVTRWAQAPWMLGWHWFQYMDEPKTGRFDGEDGNYGLVDIRDNPLEPFIGTYSKVNKDAYRLHEEGFPADDVKQ